MAAREFPNLKAESSSLSEVIFNLFAAVSACPPDSSFLVLAEQDGGRCAVPALVD